eukprot:scaffold37156_cov43-Cyclotella_meneghiniana.AAC.4
MRLIFDMHGTVHSKSDDGEANMMNEDKSLCEKVTQVLECVKKYTQDIDIPAHASLSNIVEPDVPKSSKRRAVSEKYAKWKHGTLKNAYNPEASCEAQSDNANLQEFIIEWGGYGIWLTYFGSSTSFLHCSKNICASSKPLLCQSFNTCGDATPAETMKARMLLTDGHLYTSN